MHFDEVFDVGIDYGADGGLGWMTEVVEYPNGRTRRNQMASRALGRWQLGNRTVDSAQLEYIAGFLHAMRGRLHTFLYKDWNDYRATNEQLIVDGPEVQLIKSYGLAINGWVREIRKPSASTVVLELSEDAGETFTPLSHGDDYELDASTGVVLLDSTPGAEDVLRWSGEFYVPARFNRDRIEAQFIGLEDRGAAGRQHAYELGALEVIEDPEA